MGLIITSTGTAYESAILPLADEPVAALDTYGDTVATGWSIEKVVERLEFEIAYDAEMTAEYC